MPLSRLQRAQRPLRRAGVRCDNIVLVPASLLPCKRQWQAVANGLPPGSVLVCLTRTNHRQRKVLERVSAHMRQNGHRVMTLSAERIATRTVRLPAYVNGRNPDGSSGQGSRPRRPPCKRCLTPSRTVGRCTSRSAFNKLPTKLQADEHALMSRVTCRATSGDVCYHAAG
jgi:hypothetical protein